MSQHKYLTKLLTMPYSLYGEEKKTPVKQRDSLLVGISTHARRGELDPSFLVTHRFSLEDSPRGYEMFKHKEDGCVRAVFTP